MSDKDGAKQIPLRLDKELFEKGEAKAKEDGRSFNSWVVSLIRKAVKEDASHDAG